MIATLQAVRQLLGYLFLGFSLLSNPVGWYFIYLLFNIGSDKTAFTLWLTIDRIFCRICHGTKNRTISGWTGQWQGNIKRYKYQARVINWIIFKVSREKEHCLKAFEWELKQGWIKQQ